MFRLLRMFNKRRKKKRRRKIPIVRRENLSGGKEIFQSIIGATDPGAKKLQFPYELPVIKTEIALDKGTTKVIYFLGASIGAGLILSAVVKRKSKN